MNLPEFSVKVAAIVIKRFDDGYRLLAHAFAHDPSLPLRFPGGGVEAHESIEAALFRELKEEAGLQLLTVSRKIGVVRFYKPYSRKYVERHDFLLLADPSTPNDWDFAVTGAGDDSGEVFKFRWLPRDQFHLIDIELQKFLDSAHIPELFMQDHKGNNF